MYLAMYLSFQRNFVIDKYLKMAALEPFSFSVFFFAARTRTTANLKLEQKQFFFLNLHKYS